MRARQGKRSEAFWPSLVMRKWLNIKPKVYDFSDDEIDNESESEEESEEESEDDASSIKDAKFDMDEDHLRRKQGNKFVCSSHVPDTPKSYPIRHRRGKSETLRVQYINTKDVRVTIGTWNVAGQSPCEDLALDEWLQTEEPADLYIIGFQEVVPLNAGNVLGAEDSRPIPKWEAIIRRTLNKSFEPESKHKSFSAPPSPVLRTSSVEDLLAYEAIDTQLDMMTEEFDLEQRGLTTRNLQLKRIYGIDFDSRLDWPEQSLDLFPQVLSSNSKLRRVLSNSPRTCFNSFENPMSFGPRQFALNDAGMRRSYHSSGNLISILKEQQEREEAIDSLSHVSDSLFEEEGDAFSDGLLEDENGRFATTDGAKSSPKYVRIVGKQMVGIYVSVWVRKRLRGHVNNLKVSPVGIGLMGYMGNKGSVSISMSLFQSRLCFVCSHLTSGQKDGAEQKRNADVHEIIRRTRFSSVIDAESNQPHTIPCHDKIFWFGDLNYRLNMLDSDVRQLVNLKQWDELINYDQLSRELRNGYVFEGWKEGAIDFPPTYKYEINSTRYVGEKRKEGEKKRSPAWCDRILWLGKGIKQLCYKRFEIQLSDHRPVSSIFVAEVEVLDRRKLQRALNITCAPVHPEIFLEEYDER